MFSIRLYLPLLLALAPLVCKSQMLTVAQYEVLPLDKIDTLPTDLANDSLTKELLAHRSVEKRVPVVRVAQTTSAAAAFAKKPLPFAVASPQQLATYLTQPFKDEKLKAWVLYVWMATNLKYDKNQYTPAKRHLIRLNPLEVLLYRKSICQGYANLLLRTGAESPPQGGGGDRLVQGHGAGVETGGARVESGKNQRAVGKSGRVVLRPALPDVRFLTGPERVPTHALRQQVLRRRSPAHSQAV
ncbi:transglutaminase domain-containing protein [Hymenobacter nivis]|uniref:transglutaminase domain-containing protein n=1 Tax=Hymenobacter nivis TaxID=1850093 RepID=UPI0013A58E62|nr:transglutaminase domain-containing protein [Hymenobacter nivis]